MIDSRPLILNSSKLGILVDTESFNNLLSNRNTDTELLLKYTALGQLEFIRTPGDTTYNELSCIAPLTLIHDKDSNLSSIELRTKESENSLGFGYRKESIDQIGKRLYANRFSEEIRQRLLLVFIQSILNQCNTTFILLTDQDVLLRNRVWFASHFPGQPVNIVTPNEAKEIIDLFLKIRNAYYITPHLKCSKGYYYLLSFRSKIPYFHFGDRILDAFASRFTYLLTSVDEIAFQYYSGVNNDTMDNILYHFNYFISLTTGIFDSLAIRTKKQFGISVPGGPQKISLNNKIGKDFLKEVKEKNPALRSHVNNHVDFIKLIYGLREAVIHREMHPKMRAEIESNWKGNLIEIDDNTKKLIQRCNDKPQPYEPVTEWGFYQSHNMFFLEPFRFAKASARTLIAFSAEYLKLLKFTNFLQEAKRNDKQKEFASEIELFERFRLGF
jgi:hypothetical protein